MANISSLVPITTAATALSNLVLVTPQAVQGYQPQNPTPLASETPQEPPPAFLFHYEGEQSVNLKSDITDHFIEDNTAIQDQIALRPPIVTTHGFIGELNNVPPKGLAAIKAVADKLTILGAYTPALTLSALIIYNEAFFLYQIGAAAVNSAVAAWSSLSGTAGQTVINGQGIAVEANQNRQQVAFQLFYGYWVNRVLFTVQTPWAVFQDMAIDSLTPIQDAETDVITEFRLSFKQLRFAKTTFVRASVQGRLGSQSATLTDLGTQTLRPGPSLLGRVTSGYPSLLGGG